MHIFGNAHVTGCIYALCDSKCTKRIRTPFKKGPHKYKVRKNCIKIFSTVTHKFYNLKKIYLTKDKLNELRIF